MRNIVIAIFLLFGTVSARSSDELTAWVVGSGSPVYNPERASACVLISQGDTRILVDMGNGIQANLNKLRVNDRTLSALVFTHHHLDHNEEFVPLFIRSLLGRKQFQIIGPPNTARLAKANLELYEEDIAYRLGKSGRTLGQRKSAFTARDLKGGESFEIGNIQVSTLQVPHTIHSIAYRFDYKQTSIVVTGDLTFSTSLPGLARDADFLIIDSGGMVMKGSRQNRAGNRKGRKGLRQRQSSSHKRAHLNLEESSLLAEQANVGNLVYTHFGSGEIDEEASLTEIRKNFAGEVTFAADLMVLQQPAQGTTRPEPVTQVTYAIVDTGQETFYDNQGSIPTPAPGTAFYGQDASHHGNQPSYKDNANGTVTDRVTGLVWQKGFEVMGYKEALEYAAASELAGHRDWRLPTVKELYSLIQFNGVDPSGRYRGSLPEGAKPFIDTNFFDFKYGANGQRPIDSQYVTSTLYTGKTMGQSETVFGINMADGRIKGYPLKDPRSRSAKQFSVRLVRGNRAYGKNRFVDNNDGTISDLATGLMWAKSDNQKALIWQEALSWSQQMNEKKYLNYNDWRVPDAKELQSIVDYERSPQKTASAAIDPIFNISTIKDEQGKKNYPFFWTGTTHVSATARNSSAVYICFGEALGFMRSRRSREARLVDVHGAGAQRSDPKRADVSRFPQGRGPQGDVVRSAHHVRLVREIR